MHIAQVRNKLGIENKVGPNVPFLLLLYRLRSCCVVVGVRFFPSRSAVEHYEL